MNDLCGRDTCFSLCTCTACTLGESGGILPQKNFGCFTSESVSGALLRVKVRYLVASSMIQTQHTELTSNSIAAGPTHF